MVERLVYKIYTDNYCTSPALYEDFSMQNKFMWKSMERQALNALRYWAQSTQTEKGGH
jgi:hypothetical protein